MPNRSSDARPPEPSAAPCDYRFAYKTRSLQRWLRELPLADTTQCADRLHRLIEGSAECSASPSQRLRLLEELYPAMEYVTRALLALAGRSAVPPRPRDRRATDILCAPLQSYAHAHRALLDQALEARRPDRKLLAYGLHRAVRAYAVALLGTYRLYRPVAPGVWSQVHGFYLLAEKYGISGRPLRPTRKAVTRSASVESAYLQILLMAACEPYGLRCEEQAVMERLVSNWCWRVQLQSVDQSRGPLVDLGQDLPPRPWAGDGGQKGHGAPRRRMELTELVNLLNDPGEQEPLAAAGLSDRLRQELINRWSARPLRRFSRHNAHAPARAATGLEGVRQVLDRERKSGVAHRGGQREPPPLERLFAPTPDGLERDEVSSDFWQRVAGQPLEPDITLEGDPSLGKLPAPTYGTADCTVVDISAEGCRLVWRGEGACTARVGDVISLREPGAQPGWRIGLIRWLQYHHDDGIRMGVQLIAPEGTPAMALSPQAPAERLGSASLALPGVAAVHQPPSLLTPAGCFEVGQHLELMYQDGRERVQLVRILEDTGAVHRFEYLSDAPFDDQQLAAAFGSRPSANSVNGP